MHCLWDKDLLHCGKLSLDVLSFVPFFGADVTGEARPQLGLGSGGAAANTALFPQSYPQAAHGQDIGVHLGGHTWLVSTAVRV